MHGAFCVARGLLLLLLEAAGHEAVSFSQQSAVPERVRVALGEEGLCGGGLDQRAQRLLVVLVLVLLVEHGALAALALLGRARRLGVVVGARGLVRAAALVLLVRCCCCGGGALALRERLVLLAGVPLEHPPLLAKALHEAARRQDDQALRRRTQAPASLKAACRA